jgi:CheY-like chemotaxis protein
MQTVLVVEDSPDVAALEAELIVADGRRAIVAADGVEALAILEDASVDLILLDLNLPRLSGSELLVHLTAHPRWSQIPVLVVAADLTLFRAAPPVVSVVAKPFDVANFVESIDCVMRFTQTANVERADLDSAD